MSNSDPREHGHPDSGLLRASDLRWLGMDEPAAESDTDPRVVSSLLHGLRRRWLMIVLLGIPLAIGGAAATWRLTDTEYIARAVLLFQPDADPLESPNRRNSESVLDDHATQVQRITGPDVLDAALNRPGISELKVLKGEFERVSWLEERTQAVFPGDSNVMFLTVRCTDSSAAKVLANAIVDVYLKDVVDAETSARQVRLSNLNSAADAMKSQIRTDREELARLAPNGDVDSRLPSVEEQALLARYTAKLKQLNDVQARIRQVRALEAADEEAGEEIPGEITISDAELEVALLRDPKTQGIEQSITRVQGQIDSAKTRLREPQLSEYLSDYETRIDALKQQLSERAAELRQELILQKEVHRQMQLAPEVQGVDLAALEELEAELSADLGNIEAEASRFEHGEKSVEAGLLEAKIKSDEELLRQLNTEASVLKLIVDNTAQVVTPLNDASITPGEAEKRRIMKCGGMGMLTFLVWTASIIGLDFRRRRVGDPTDVSIGLQLRVLGIVPLVKRSRRKNLEQSERFAEAVDGISAELLCGTIGSEHRIVMISSALAGEGKTTLAANLASSLANAGQRVLLVDFDLRRPMLHSVFGVEVQPGVGEVLSGECQPKDAVHELDDSPLRLMTAGRWRRASLSHLTDQAVARLFDSVRGDYDFIIVDASPILPAIDTRIVARHVDGVVLSMLRDVSERPKVKAACEVLKSFDAKVLGAVVIGAAADLYYGYFASEGRKRA